MHGVFKILVWADIWRTEKVRNFKMASAPTLEFFWMVDFFFGDDVRALILTFKCNPKSSISKLYKLKVYTSNRF